MYPEVMQSNHGSPLSSKTNPPSSTLYPTIDLNDLVENLFSDSPPDSRSPSAATEAIEEVILRIPGAIINLIDKDYSVELASGDFTILHLVQGDNIVAVLARVADDIQWPLTKDEAAVKLDDSHYFFSLPTPKGGSGSDDDEQEGSDDFLNYGLTIASKGQEDLVKQLDEVLKMYSGFSIQKVSKKGRKGEALDGSLALETSPEEFNAGKKKELMEERSAAYWTTLAPNVEDYSGTAAKLIAAGSGQLIRGILWCGDVTVERLKWGNEVLKKRMDPCSNKEISPETMKRIKRYEQAFTFIDIVFEVVSACYEVFSCSFWFCWYLDFVLYWL